MPRSTISGRRIARRQLFWIVAGVAAAAASAALAPGRGLAGTQGGSPLLPRDVVIPLTAVNGLFPEVTQEASTGSNPTAVGTPSATRIVIYESGDGAKRVTISVDQYPSLDAAASAFQQAIQLSEVVPGSNPLPAPNLGDQSFAGTVTQGTETHVGLGVLSGVLLVGATIAGYDASPDNIANLIALASVENNAAVALLGGIPSK